MSETHVVTLSVKRTITLRIAADSLIESVEQAIKSVTGGTADTPGADVSVDSIADQDGVIQSWEAHEAICPNCDSTGELWVEATTMIQTDEDGVNDHGDMQYGVGAAARCADCGWRGHLWQAAPVTDGALTEQE